MHGYALLFLLSKGFRQLSTQIAEKRPLKMMVAKPDKWDEDEVLKYPDVFIIGLFRRYFR